MMSLKGILKKWYISFTQLRWTIGVADFDPETILDPKAKLNIHWVKHNNKDSWFADPFILSVSEDYIYILVEEFIYSSNRGRISRLKVNRHNWELEKIESVIDISTHLSFPIYFRENGKVYIYPESTKTGKLTLYEYDESTGKAIPIRDLCMAPLADAVIWQFKGKKVIAGTKAPNDNGRVLELHPFNEEAPQVETEPIERIEFPERIARNAGMPFELQGRFFRPAQNCARRYGECVIIQEFNESDNGLKLKEVNRLYSPLISYKVAFHTFNVFENKYVAVDAEGMRFGLIAQIFYFIRECFR